MSRSSSSWVRIRSLMQSVSGMSFTFFTGFEDDQAGVDGLGEHALEEGQLPVRRDSP